MTAFAAVDLGASSGRVMLGRVGSDHSDHIELTEVHRFRNGGVRLPDGLYWDVLGLYTDVLTGLRAAAREDRLAGLAIDSWAVDYGLLDARGSLVGNPRHYRDPRTDAVIDDVHATLDPARLYGVTGLQFLPFNTLYQLAAEPALDGRRALLMPDLLGYWLTGRQVAEETNASTTGLLDARTGGWSTPLVEALGLPSGLLPDVIAAGAVLAPLTAEVGADIGVDYALPVTTVGSHDTASAVVGVPADNPRFGYISCGTWGLVGVELDAPVLTEDSRKANFTNERGVDGTIRYLRNVMGLWLLSESMRTWDLRGRGVELGHVLAAAAVLPAGGPRVDPNDPVFLPPGDMPGRIAAAAGLRDPEPEVVVRCILDSLAVAFAGAVSDAERLSGRPVEVVHLVGGGSQNALLCQLTADAVGRPVVAGPVEATALGNVLVQARTHGVLSGDLAALRGRVRAASRLHRYEPR
jgi:rhamnulokinase